MQADLHRRPDVVLVEAFDDHVDAACSPGRRCSWWAAVAQRHLDALAGAGAQDERLAAHVLVEPRTPAHEGEIAGVDEHDRRGIEERTGEARARVVDQPQQADRIVLQDLPRRHGGDVVGPVDAAGRAGHLDDAAGQRDPRARATRWCPWWPWHRPWTTERLRTCSRPSSPSRSPSRPEWPSWRRRRLPARPRLGPGSTVIWSNRRVRRRRLGRASCRWSAAPARTCWSWARWCRRCGRSAGCPRRPIHCDSSAALGLYRKSANRPSTRLGTRGISMSNHSEMPIIWLLR